MIGPRGALPTLTEVIEVHAEAPASAPAVLPPESLPLETQQPVPADLGAALTTQVIESLRPRIDALLDAQLEAAIAPRLSRLVEALAQDLRVELAGALQALVAQAVDEVLSRRRRP